MPSIHAVLFDYGLVLTGPPDPRAWSRMQSILGADDPAFHNAYWRHRLDYDLGKFGGRRYWQIIAADLHRDPTTDDLAALIDADIDLWTQPNQPMIDWAAALQRAHITTGLLSNIGDDMEAGIRSRCPWFNQFQQFTFSHRLGIAKPDERIYRHAIDGLGVRAEQTLFLDDRIENVAAARAVGLNAIQYSSHDDFLRQFNAGGFSGLPQPDTTPSRSS